MFKKFFILLFLTLSIDLSFNKIEAHDMTGLGTFDFENMDQRSSNINDFLNFSKSFYQTPLDFLVLGDSEKRDITKVRDYLTKISSQIYWSDFFRKFSLKQYPMGYKEVRTFSIDLLKRHYSKLYFDTQNTVSSETGKNVYVFIGTSPITPVIAFLEALKSQSSNIKDGKIKESLDSSIFIDIPYSVSLFNEHPSLSEKEIFKHFSKYIDPSIIEGNNLIFVDLAKSGVNIGSFIRVFKKYLFLSNVKEASFSADIFTFFSQEFYTDFLKRLSGYPGINVLYSKKYFSFLMRNLYIHEYDDAFSDYYDFFFNDIKRTMYLTFYGDYLYAESLFDREFLYFYGESVYLSKVNNIYEPFLISGKYIDGWMNYVRGDKKIPIDKKFEDMKKIYMQTIEKDSFFNGYFCSRLFGNR